MALAGEAIDQFNLALDTGAMSPAEAAHAIVNRTENATAGEAFSRLAERFGP